MKFKNVVTYYLDGKPNGVRRCRIEGSVIEALVIPREAVKDAKALADVLPKHGIYFLIEDKEGIDLPKVYAGQTTNGLGRLYDHKANKEFWTLAVMFLSKDEHFHLDVALESLAIKGIVESERYDSDNKVDPKFKISIYQQQVVENYFTDIKFLMAALGWNIEKKPVGDKGEWHARDEQRRHNAHNDEWQAEDDDEHLLPTVEQQQHDNQNQEEGNGEEHQQRASSFARASSFTLPRQRIASGQLDGLDGFTDIVLNLVGRSLIQI